MAQEKSHQSKTKDTASGKNRYDVTTDGQLNNIALYALMDKENDHDKDYTVFFEKKHAKEYKTSDGSKLETIYEVTPRSFPEICALAGKQGYKTGDEACAGYTKSMGVIIEALKYKNEFIKYEEEDKKTADEKMSLGLTKEKISYFDLLEIGVCEKASLNLTAAETFVRNQNLIEIYSAKHSGSPLEVVNKIRKAQEGQFSQNKLHTNLIINTGDKLSLSLEKPNEIFLTAIRKAVAEYEKTLPPKGTFFSHFRSQSKESNLLVENLKTALTSNPNDKDKVDAVANVLANATCGKTFSNILKKAGILDHEGKSTIPAPSKSEKTEKSDETKKPSP